MTTQLAAEHRPTGQARARHPDAAGFVERDGVRVCWE